MKGIAFEQLPRPSRLNLTAFAAWHATFTQGKMISTHIALISRIHKLPIPLVLFPSIEKWLQNCALAERETRLKRSVFHSFYTCDPCPYESLMPSALQLISQLVRTSLQLHLPQHALEPLAHSVIVASSNGSHKDY